MYSVFVLLCAGYGLALGYTWSNVCVDCLHEKAEPHLCASDHSPKTLRNTSKTNLPAREGSHSTSSTIHSSKRHTQVNDTLKYWRPGRVQEWVMSHINGSCHTWMSHVTHEWVMSHMNESSHTWMRHVTGEWVISQVNESCRIWMRAVTYECVLSHMTESFHTCETFRGKNGTNSQEWVMSHVNKSCYTYKNGRARQTRLCDMPHSHVALLQSLFCTTSVTYESFVCMTWLIYHI